VQRHLQKLATRDQRDRGRRRGGGQGRYGMILWVKPRDYARAARALGAR